MSLKSKALLIFAVILAVSIAVTLAIQMLVLLPEFAALERKEARKDLQRVVETIKSENHHISKLCWDWSSWDDTCDFIADRSEKYIKTNLPLSTFTINRINLFYFIGANGTVVWGKILDFKTEKPIPLKRFQRNVFSAGDPLLPKTAGDVVSGIIQTEKGPMLVAARPILTSDNEGPLRGTLIVGRLLDEEILKTIGEQSKADFTLHPVEMTAFSASQKKSRQDGNGEAPYRFEKQGDSYLLVRTTLPDIEGKYEFLVTAKTYRAITAQGHITARYALIALIGSMAVILLIMLFVLRKTILEPIIALKRHALSIEKSGDMTARLSLKSRDEIGDLGRAFDRMMEKLENGARTLRETNDRLQTNIDLRIATERALRESEEKLAQAKKMESLGLMAGGIAHDLNNILSGIITYPELLLMDLSPESRFWKPLTTIHKSGLRAAEVVADLLTIARGVAAVKTPLSLNTAIEEYLDSPEHQALTKSHPSVAFETRFDKRLLKIPGSSVHLKKTLMNLTANAAEAVEGAGNVTIATENRYIDKPVPACADIPSGKYVVLSVADNGTGISPEDKERIFEPFYTKKMMGRSGTGLGLAVVWNTMQDHNGHIQVVSSESGTTFELYFPATREETQQETPDAAKEEWLGHGETILVVDDEEPQREIACALLARLGYRAEAAASGEAAIEYIKNHPADLLILDMVMPKGLGGRETYQKILGINPRQKAIIATGYAMTEEVELARKLGAGDFVKKPYTLGTIGLAIRSALKK